MSDISKIFSCGCCTQTFPSIYKHTHHIKPRALGGKDTPDNLIDLCPGCHDALHNVAWKLMSKKYSQAQVIDSISIIYKQNDKAKEKCLELAMLVRNAMIVSGEQHLDPNQLINISTTIRKHHKTLITSRCKELRTSQENYIRGLIIQDLAKRYSIPLSVSEEKLLIKQIKKSKSSF